MTKIEWVRGDDGSEGLSWNALRAVRWIPDPKGSGMKKVSANHCEHVNEACRFCYADRQNARLGGLPFKPGHRKDYTFEIDEKKLLEPLRRKKPTRIFCESMSDVFGEWWPEEFIDQKYAVMGMTPWHTFINLSKRGKRRRDYLNKPTKRNDVELAAERIRPSKGLAVSPKWCFPWPLPNVIEGISVSCQPEAEEDVPVLLATNAALRGVSAEPLLGPIDFRRWLPHECVFPGEGQPGDPCQICRKWTSGLHHPWAKGDLDWLIVGGESGPKARPMHPQWARDIRDQCKAAGVEFFFKQWGEWAPTAVVGTGARDAIPSHVFREQGTIKTFGGPIPLGTEMRRVGKKAAGRLLDGIEHNGFPALRLAEVA